MAFVGDIALITDTPKYGKIGSLIAHAGNVGVEIFFSKTEFIKNIKYRPRELIVNPN